MKGPLHIVVIAALLGCSGRREARGAKFGEQCVEDEDCESGRCNWFDEWNGLQPERWCTLDCATDAECRSGSVCGDVAVDERVCASRCSTDGYGWICDEGAPKVCELVPEGEACGTCGCPEGQFCNDGEECVDELEQGQPCERDWECRSQNCGIPEVTQDWVCLVPLGSPCTDSNCAACWGNDEEGDSFCTRHCDCENTDLDEPEGSCGYCKSDTICVGDPTAYCRPYCETNGDCPGDSECTQVRSAFDSFWVCLP